MRLDFKSLKALIIIVISMAEANLIVTYEPTHKGKAGEEVKELLDEVGGCDFLDSEYDGLFLLHTKQDSKKIVSKLHEMCKEETHKFRYTSRWIPVEKWTKSAIDEMEKAVKSMEERIKPEETWKMDLGKRGFEGDAMEIVMKLTEQIDRPKVSLKSPQKIVKIEIVGDRAALSLLEPDEYLNIAKMKK